MTDEPLDCLIIGAGPAGLVAALYLARYRRRVTIVDAGDGRAEMIPVSHNYPGFPGGISGSQLLSRLRAQALRYGVVVRRGRVDDLARNDSFVARVGDEEMGASTVLLATGVVDRQPQAEHLPDLRSATLAGRVRWCPICDGFEGMDRRIALIAPAATAVAHAMFLRTYTDRLTVFVEAGEAQLTPADRVALAEAGVRTVDAAVIRIRRVGEDLLGVSCTAMPELRFDVLYPMLGTVAQSALATALGAECDEQGELVVDDHQETSVARLYAAGDIVKALNQMSVGMAHAALAATAIHNGLGKRPR